MKKENKAEKSKTPNRYQSIYRGDAMGSYTGIPAEPFDTPVQDADDL